METAVNLAAPSRAITMDHDLSYAQPGVEQQFEALFKAHFKGLHAYAATVVYDDDVAEDIVQQTFLKLWERRDTMYEIDSPAAYVYRSVYNASLNYQKHVKVKAAYQQYATQQQMSAERETVSASPAVLKELELRIDAALKELPEQCRTIFQMSRFEDLKYREIADRLGLSVKTIEAQMGKALRILRTKLVDYLPAGLIWLIFYY